MATEPYWCRTRPTISLLPSISTGAIMETLVSPARLREGLLQKEAALKLGTTTRTLQRWQRANFGPQPYRDGGRLLYDPTDLAAFIAGAR